MTNIKKSKKKKPGNKFLEFLPFDYLFAAFVCALCSVSTLNIITGDGTFNNVNFNGGLSFLTFIALTITAFGVILIFVYLLNKRSIIPWFLTFSSVSFAVLLAFLNRKEIYFNIGIALVLLLVFAWVAKDDKMNLTKIVLPKNTVWFVSGILALLFVVLVSVASIARYSSYSAHNFDFGIFTQMFENMRTTGMADTTVERNVLMSHFGVHFSPIFYLVLPFYAIVPRPETILVIQALVVAIGVIPVVLICKKLNLSKNLTMVFAFVYLSFPSLANGCLYDFHENKFLTTLILWTLYFMVSKKTPLLILFSSLTLMVKEDAAIYIMAIALFIIVSRKEFIIGGILFGVSIIYFAFATMMVSAFNVINDGIMIDRLNNFIPSGEEGFGAIIQTCLTNFGYFLAQVFTQEKIAFMFWMLLPVAFAPFLSKNKSILVLFIPMVVVDLMSNWQYQYNINYQYTFGVAALIIFMALIAVKDLKREKKILVSLVSMSLCLVFTFSLFVPRMIDYVEYDNRVKTTTDGYNELIATIPKDAQVTANGYYIPHMYDFKNLYQYPNYYSQAVKTEYLLVNKSDVAENEDDLQTFMGQDYQLIDSSGNMELYKLKW